MQTMLTKSERLTGGLSTTGSYDASLGAAPQDHSNASVKDGQNEQRDAVPHDKAGGDHFAKIDRAVLLARARSEFAELHLLGRYVVGKIGE